MTSIGETLQYSNVAPRISLRDCCNQASHGLSNNHYDALVLYELTVSSYLFLSVTLGVISLQVG